jgi:hypothetical protein
MTLADLEKLEAKLRKSPKDANLQLEIGARPRAPSPHARVAGREDERLLAQASRRASRPVEACRAADAPSPAPLTCLSRRVQ